VLQRTRHGIQYVEHTEGTDVEHTEGTGCCSRSRWDVLMNRKFIVAVLLIAAVPVCAHAQNLLVTKDDAQKVVTIISGDKAKIQTYCEIQELGEQMERAYEKRNLKLVDELLQKIETMEKTLGPEYVALMEGLDLVDPEKDKLGAEMLSIVASIDRLCTR
jgi:hypothetical protein